MAYQDDKERIKELEAKLEYYKKEADGFFPDEVEANSLGELLISSGKEAQAAWADMYRISEAYHTRPKGQRQFYTDDFIKRAKRFNEARKKNDANICTWVQYERRRANFHKNRAAFLREQRDEERKQNRAREAIAKRLAETGDLSHDDCRETVATMQAQLASTLVQLKTINGRIKIPMEPYQPPDRTEGENITLDAQETDAPPCEEDIPTLIKNIQEALFEAVMRTEVTAPANSVFKNVQYEGKLQEDFVSQAARINILQKKVAAWEKKGINAEMKALYEKLDIETDKDTLEQQSLHPSVNIEDVRRRFLTEIAEHKCSIKDLENQLAKAKEERNIERKNFKELENSIKAGTGEQTLENLNQSTIDRLNAKVKETEEEIKKVKEEVRVARGKAEEYEEKKRDAEKVIQNRNELLSKRKTQLEALDSAYKRLRDQKPASPETKARSPRPEWEREREHERELYEIAQVTVISLQEAQEKLEGQVVELSKRLSIYEGKDGDMSGLKKSGKQTKPGSFARSSEQDSWAAEKKKIAEHVAKIKRLGELNTRLENEAKKLAAEKSKSEKQSQIKTVPDDIKKVQQLAMAGLTRFETHLKELYNWLEQDSVIKALGELVTKRKQQIDKGHTAIENYRGRINKAVEESKQTTSGKTPWVEIQGPNSAPQIQGEPTQREKIFQEGMDMANHKLKEQERAIKREHRSGKEEKDKLEKRLQILKDCNNKLRRVIEKELVSEVEQHIEQLKRANMELSESAELTHGDSVNDQDPPSSEDDPPVDQQTLMLEATLASLVRRIKHVRVTFGKYLSKGEVVFYDSEVFDVTPQDITITSRLGLDDSTAEQSGEERKETGVRIKENRRQNIEELAKLGAEVAEYKERVETQNEHEISLSNRIHDLNVELQSARMEAESYKEQVDVYYNVLEMAENGERKAQNDTLKEELEAARTETTMEIEAREQLSEELHARIYELESELDKAKSDLVKCTSETWQQRRIRTQGKKEPIKTAAKDRKGSRMVDQLKTPTEHENNPWYHDVVEAELSDPNQPRRSKRNEKKEVTAAPEPPQISPAYKHVPLYSSLPPRKKGKPGNKEIARLLSEPESEPEFAPMEEGNQAQDGDGLSDSSDVSDTDVSEPTEGTRGGKGKRAIKTAHLLKKARRIEEKKLDPAARQRAHDRKQAGDISEVGEGGEEDVELEPEPEPKKAAKKQKTSEKAKASPSAKRKRVSGAEEAQSQAAAEPEAAPTPKRVRINLIHTPKGTPQASPAPSGGENEPETTAVAPPPKPRVRPGRKPKSDNTTEEAPAKLSKAKPLGGKNSRKPSNKPRLDSNNEEDDAPAPVLPQKRGRKRKASATTTARAAARKSATKRQNIDNFTVEEEKEEEGQTSSPNFFNDGPIRPRTPPPPNPGEPGFEAWMEDRQSRRADMAAKMRELRETHSQRQK